jgi:hypothetical protein
MYIERRIRYEYGANMLILSSNYSPRSYYSTYYLSSPLPYSLASRK